METAQQTELVSDSCQSATLEPFIQILQYELVLWKTIVLYQTQLSCMIGHLWQVVTLFDHPAIGTLTLQ